MGNLHSLSELYQKKLFRIPDYQRGYAWTHSQLEDFWSDILTLREGRYHYIGMLSLKMIPRSVTKKWENEDWLLSSKGEGYKAYHVVDGQQRLTTVAILISEIVAFTKRHNKEHNLGKQAMLQGQTMKEIREKYIARRRPPKDLVTSYLFGYEVDNPSAEYLVYKIFCEPFSGTIEETYYTRNLKYAQRFFCTHLKKLYDQKGARAIDKIFHKVTMQLMFNIHKIENDYDVFVAFETMNNRGKRLTNLELLKNRLIYLSTLYSDDVLDVADRNELRKKINAAWKEVYYQLGRDCNQLFSDDDYLKSHWIIYFKNAYSFNQEECIDYLLDKFSAENVFVKKKSNALNPYEIADYVNSLKGMAEYWLYTFFPEQSDLSDEEKIWLQRLERIGITYFRPLISVALSTTSATTKDRIAFFKAVERFIFISFKLGDFGRKHHRDRYYQRAYSLYKNEIKLAEVTNDLVKMADNNMNHAIASFANRMERYFAYANGFYSWKGLRYFFYEYEYEKAKETGVEKISWNPFTNIKEDKPSIEHILPRSATNPYWEKHFKAYTDDELRILSDSLGNLLALSQAVNMSLQNDGFIDKKSSKIKGRRGYVDGSHSEIEVSREQDWDAKRILKRGLKLLEFMEKRWDIKFQDKKQKIELLHLSFVKQ